MTSLPDEFVVKPSRGARGWGVELFQRREGVFIDSSGRVHRPEDMAAAFFTDERYASFVIQERRRAHPALQALSGTPGLQTVRIVTDVDDVGTVRIAFAFFRVIGGGTFVDNFDGGLNGNLLCCVDPAGGLLATAVGPSPDGIGVVEVPRHPRTGIPFEGFRLPDWEATCALAERAALLFLPMRSIGWDIAPTPEGPCLVEANKRWDPCNVLVAGCRASDLVDDVAGLLARLRRTRGQG